MLLLLREVLYYAYMRMGLHKPIFNEIYVNFTKQLIDGISS